MIEDGEAARTTEYEVGAGINLSSKLVKGGGYPIKLPFIDVSEIGAGGGSIVRIDESGALKVGPQSAGAVPGPMCYGLGGTRPTFTDAMVVLGYLNPVAIAGGRVKLDAARARAAIEAEVAKPLGLDLAVAAHGVYTLAAATMTRAVKAVTTYRGRDPRDFALVAFGGNGPIAAVEIARALEIKDVLIPLGVAFPLVAALVMVGFSNAVNLTDGLDGLAIVPTIIAAGVFALIAYLVGNRVFADYLQLNFVPGVGELAIFCSALIGAGLGFLWFSAPPAAVFMGDTGSLALGGALGAVAVAVKHEIVLAIVGGLFVVETVSVIIQVAWYKRTKRRVFLMAPLHHHFEKKGWSEPTIVIRFWIIAMILALIGLGTLKIR